MQAPGVLRLTIIIRDTEQEDGRKDYGVSFVAYDGLDGLRIDEMAFPTRDNAELANAIARRLYNLARGEGYTPTILEMLWKKREQTCFSTILTYEEI